MPHPIRPWELWHPAAEPVHLFRNDPEERVSWNDMTDGDDPAIDGDAWVPPDLELEGAGSGDDRFGFGRLRPFTRAVTDAPDLTEPAPSPPDAAAPEPEASVAVALPPTSLSDEVAPQTDGDGVGDVLFRELVSPDRMTASEQALEDPAQESSGGLLINGPVSRRTDRDHDRSRRRLPVGLRVVGGEAEGATDT